MTDDIKTLQDAAKHLLPIYEHLANGGSMNDVQESSFIQGQEWHPAGGGVIVNITGVLGNGFRYRLKPEPYVRFGLCLIVMGMYAWVLSTAKKPPRSAATSLNDTRMISRPTGSFTCARSRK